MTQTQQAERSRTFTWTDPTIGLAHLGRVSGLELLHAIIAGELPTPPVLQMIRVERMEVREGEVTVLMAPQEFHYNPLGTVHGGVLATVMDTAAGCAVHSTLPAGRGYTSLDLNTRFLRPVTVGSGMLRCTGAVLSSGRSTALAESRLEDESGRLMAHATSTCLLFDMA